MLGSAAVLRFGSTTSVAGLAPAIRRTAPRNLSFKLIILPSSDTAALPALSCSALPLLLQPCCWIGLLASTSYSPLPLNRDFAFRFSYVAWSYRKIPDLLRSEERRVGKECRSRW